MKLVIENLQESIMIFDKKNLINVNRMFTQQFGTMITQHFNEEIQEQIPSTEIKRRICCFSLLFNKIKKYFKKIPMEIEVFKENSFV